MKLSAKTIVTHLAVILFFIIASMAYFYPVIQGKGIYQSDIAQYTGMAKERNDYKKNTGIESYWTNHPFGGMPTYQLGANYPHDYVKKLDRIIRFLPRPADYLFLYFIGFYILMLCMKVDWRLAILGSLAFGFSTYYIIILGVGHNAKAHALGYLPMLLGGILLVFRKKYVLGFILTAIAMALEISANHYQMTYYFMLLVLILGLVYLVDAIRKRNLKHFFLSVGILVGAVLLGIATNATGLMATKEFADWSTRGKSALTINPDGSEKEIKNGLDREYITHYSYGVVESLNLFVPRLFGGANAEDLGKDSKAYEFLTGQGLPPSRALEFTEALPLYWGKQPGTSGPAYIGAVVFFLFILSLFLVKGKKKWWLLGGVVLSLVLSWGKNFPTLTNFMIDYFPLYTKFRAVSSIQVILELCVPILAILGIKRLFSETVKKTEKLRAIKLSTIIAGGLVIGLLLVKGMFDFEGLSDATYLQYFGEELMTMIQRDREAVYVNDSLRSLIYVLLIAAVVFLMVRGSLKRNFALVAVGVLIVFDLVGVNQRYVNEGDFVRQRLIDQPYQAGEADRQIQADKSIFRVFDPSEGLVGSRTAYFHKTLSGYHAAKPAKLQDLFEFHLYSNNLDVLNMLNVKYIFQEDEEGRRVPSINPDANGPAWFVENLIAVANADTEISALDSLNTKRFAVFDTATNAFLKAQRFEKDSLSSIVVKDHRPDIITYETNNLNRGFVVFSEMHYPKGWVTTIDGTEVPHYRVNYALRGIEVPSGKHEITFRFDPEVVKTGSTITLASNIVLGLVVLGGMVWLFRRPKKKAHA
ncbi:MAG: YfhO family protein [Bacteroidota bacterium]